ncbi:MAG: GNAT family N-acetyltransferase [Bacilli bacterium]|nr:GNAT family N-acetyltransferase [Bacilli bacterium]
MKLIAIHEDEFVGIYEEMTKSFIEDEIRSFDDAYVLLELDSYNIYHIVIEEKRVGFITVWDLSTCFFVEHFVIYEEYRNSGFGGKAIDIVNEKFKQVILEAELPLSNISIRRLGFYNRHGYKVNDVEYIQPPYNKDKKEVPMHLLSYPDKIKNPKEIIKELHKIVYGVEDLC